jgi:hypothetical protein
LNGRKDKAPAEANSEDRVGGKEKAETEKKEGKGEATVGEGKEGGQSREHWSFEGLFFHWKNK